MKIVLSTTYGRLKHTAEVAAKLAGCLSTTYGRLKRPLPLDLLDFGNPFYYLWQIETGAKCGAPARA